VAEFPPGAAVLPERVKGTAVALQPLAKVLPNVAGGRLEGRPDASGCVVQRLVSQPFALA
jgi:hypothetical protein